MANKLLIEDSEQQEALINVSGRKAGSIRVTGDGPLTDDHKKRLLIGLYRGLSVADVLSEEPDIPGWPAIRKALRVDDNFSEAYREAMEAGTEASIIEAASYLRDVRSSMQQSAGAARYLDGLTKVAGILQPKRFAPTSKLAGHDGGRLSVNVVSFENRDLAPKVINARPTDVTDASTDDVD